MISKIKFLSLPFSLSPIGSNPDGFFWENNRFYYTNDPSRTFYLSFPKSPVSISKVKIRTTNDVYPDNFTISVSNGNNNWRTIIKNASLCDEETREKKHAMSLGCKNNIIRSFRATPIKGFYKNLRFVMSSNTYYESNREWVNLITFKGFELEGKFLFEVITSAQKNIVLNEMHMFLIILLFVYS